MTTVYSIYRTKNLVDNSVAITTNFKFLLIYSHDVISFRYIPAAISIKHLLEHGKSSNQMGSYLFLKKEIPTRLANMIMELQLLPEDLKKQNECSQILNDYVSSFR